MQEIEGADFCAAMRAGIQGCIGEIKREAIAACKIGPTLLDAAEAMRSFSEKYRHQAATIVLSVNGSPVVPMEAVAAYIHEEMIRNMQTSGAQDIISNNASVSNRASSYKAWIALVAAGKDWDHKSKIRGRFMDWSYDVGTQMLYAYDIWSNLHYGFIGCAVGFSEVELFSGAAAASVKDNGLKFLVTQGSLDDIRDVQAIRLGIELWNETGGHTSVDDVVSLVRSNASSLNTYQCTCSPCL